MEKNIEDLTNKKQDFNKITENTKKRIINFDDCCVAYRVNYWYCKGIKNGCFFESDVFGSGPYTNDSGTCKAALHQGIIGKNGGFVKVVNVGRLSSFTGSIKNKITSLDWKQPFDAVELDFVDIPFEKYSDISCGSINLYYCKGLNNSCEYLSYKSLEAVYGSNPYSIDSNKCKSALHSGCIGPDGGYYIVYPVGQVRSFRGTKCNDIATFNYPNYYEGFKCSTLNSDLLGFISNNYQNEICNKVYIDQIFYCKGEANGCADDYGVWGSNPYTFDSSACKSALHSGVINKYGGIYKVKGFEIYNSFHGTLVNGIKSEDWFQKYEGMKLEKLD